MMTKSEPYIAVIGGMNLDIQGKSFGPFRPADSNPGASSAYPGGVGRNMAENLARLGAKVELVSVLGDDELAPVLEGACEAAGVGLGGLLRLRGASSPRYLCLLDSDGRLVGAVAAMEAMDALTPERLEERAGLLDAASIILVDANLREDAISYLAGRYPRGSGGPLLGFDPVSVAKAPRFASCLGSFYFAKPNKAEAALLGGLGGPAGELAPGEALQRLEGQGPGRGLRLPGGRGPLGGRTRGALPCPAAAHARKPRPTGQRLWRGRRRLRRHRLGHPAGLRFGRALLPSPGGSPRRGCRRGARESLHERGPPKRGRERTRL